MIRGVLLDIAGVLHEGGAAIPGAAEAVARMRNAGLPVRFVTNTTRAPKRAVVARLREMGIEAGDDDVATPAALACDWLAREGYAPHLLVHPDLAEDFAGCPDAPRQAVVLGDAGEGFTYAALNAAFRRIAAGAPFLALAANRVFRDADGELSLDAGAFVRALEHASGVEARVLGKPSPGFFEGAVARLGCAPGEAAMVGDDAEADVAGARAAGLGLAILVRTGKYREGDETAHAPPPDAVVGDLAEAADLILARRA
jgi:HAD superfamily hydrolase (TIGR01458 family)